jgi:tRNA/tmRNA/rRNA uracil-C5-methylase (TrmA/RlmC/RlmD family)
METVELSLGNPAAGGGFVARDGDGRVVFVRHGLPGERVKAVLTEEHARWARADAIEILEASPERVRPPCPVAGPGGCGGCDYQHAELGAQRRFKSQLVSEQLRRVAGLELAVEVEGLSDDGLGTRTRVRYGVGPDGRIGMRRRGSSELVAVDRCPLGVEGILNLELAAERFEAGNDVQVVALEGAGEVTVAVVEWSEDDDELDQGSVGLLDAPGAQLTTVGDHRYRVSPSSFWQVHRRAPALLVEAVLAGLSPQPGELMVDLYAGAGLFSVPLAAAVGPDGLLVAVESSPDAAADARHNLRSFIQAQVIEAVVSEELLEELLDGVVGVVLDPPRAGCDKASLDLLSASTSIDRLVLVSCDPGTFARDLRRLLDAGWTLGELRALDLFEMTEHVELVASLRR